MNLEDHLGDRFDLVKRSFLQWLAPCGMWDVHPMFTGTFSADQVDSYARILGITRQALVDSEEYLAHGRLEFLKKAKSSGNHLFLDPDTGLSFQAKQPGKKRITTEELIEIAEDRPDKLTLVYDQSFTRERGSDFKRRQTKLKLQYLSSMGLSGFAYVSDIALTLVSSDTHALLMATDTIHRSTQLPVSRRNTLFVGPCLP